jgi:hypothetical protein
LKGSENKTKAKIAVATVSGKAYYLTVNELKRKNTPFVSIKPQETVPVEVKVVITTEKEKPRIKHERILTLQDGTDPEKIVNEAIQITRGKEHYEKIVIGVDPGEVFGLAILGDGEVIETCNCFSVRDTLEKIRNVLQNLKGAPFATLQVKVGDGVPECKEKLLLALDKSLSSNVMLESVSEIGTNRQLENMKHRRGLRDIVSAIKIAGRNGHLYARRKTDESNS